MTQPLKDRIALVTGSGRGIGRATAELLADTGARVVLTARTPAELDEVATAIRERGGEAETVAGDLVDDSFVDSLFDGIRQRCGRLDILVNNAGMAPFGAAEKMPVAQFRACLELNVVAAFHCMQQAIRLMKENGDQGKIVNIGSVLSHWCESGAGAYTASKHALRAMSESVARQLHGSDSRIAITLIAPGVVDTRLVNPRGEPRPGWLKPEQIARAVLHAVTAPADVNVFNVTVIPMAQSPW